MSQRNQWVWVNLTNGKQEFFDDVKVGRAMTNIRNGGLYDDFETVFDGEKLLLYVHRISSETQTLACYIHRSIINNSR